MDIIEKGLAAKEPLLEAEALALLQVQPDSREAFYLRWAGLCKSRALSGGKAEIHAQIGLDSGPCPKVCQFCAFASVNNDPNAPKKPEASLEEVLAYAEGYAEAGANAILLLSTEAYDFDTFLEMGVRVRERIGFGTPLLANTGDLTPAKAEALRNAGFAGLYHALRLGEGEVTDIRQETRLSTMEAARMAGLPLSTCLEPIGPEHSAEAIYAIAAQMLALKPITAGVGRRVAVPGVEASRNGVLSQPQNAVYAAAYRLIDHRSRLTASAHSELMANSGANIAWSEVGSNPRDRESKTESGKGRSIEFIRNLFTEAGWELLSGPSPGWAG
jgi:biotin synthase